jgi:hypothetical protein
MPGFLQVLTGGSKMKSKHWSPEVDDTIASELLAGEYVKWAGRPNPMRLASKDMWKSVIGLAFLLFLLIVMAGPVAFMSVSSSAVMVSEVVPDGLGSPADLGGPVVDVIQHGPTGMATGLFGVVPVLIGLVFLGIVLSLILRPLTRFLEAQRTRYAITNRRVLIVNGLFSRRVQSIGGEDIERIERHGRGDGYGDLILGYETRTRYMHSNVTNMHHRRDYREPYGLLAVPDVRQVEAVLLDTFRPDHDADLYDEKSKHDDFFSDPAADSDDDWFEIDPETGAARPRQDY